ncbi:MAG: hypothetical protein PHI12_12955 [Dehalococcoidales bacterium]|nr:hypothetical protein [Dehalococcoidales bacterium]
MDEPGAIPEISEEYKRHEAEALARLKMPTCHICHQPLKMGDEYVIIGFGDGAQYHRKCYEQLERETSKPPTLSPGQNYWLAHNSMGED